MKKSDLERIEAGEVQAEAAVKVLAEYILRLWEQLATHDERICALVRGKREESN